MSMMQFQIMRFHMEPLLYVVASCNCTVWSRHGKSVYVSVCGSTCQVLEGMLVLYSKSVKHCWIFKCLLVYWDLQYKSTYILTWKHVCCYNTWHIRLCEKKKIYIFHLFDIQKCLMCIYFYYPLVFLLPPRISFIFTGAHWHDAPW